MCCLSKTPSGLQPPPFSNALVNDAPQVEKLYSEIKTLVSLFKNDLAPALNITVTFNDNDED